MIPTQKAPVSTYGQFSRDRQTSIFEKAARYGHGADDTCPTSTGYSLSNSRDGEKTPV